MAGNSAGRAPEIHVYCTLRAFRAIIFPIARGRRGPLEATMRNYCSILSRDCATDATPPRGHSSL